MLEQSQHRSNESESEKSDNLETANNAEYCENDTKPIDENTAETNGVQYSLTESNGGNVEVNSNNVSWQLLLT